MVHESKHDSQGPVSRIQARKAIYKPPTRLLCKAGLFKCCKGLEIKINVKFRAWRLLRLENIKRIISPAMRPKRVSGLSRNGPQASVVQRLDSAIQQIHHYSLDK